MDGCEANEDDKETADEIRAELVIVVLTLTGLQTASKGWIRRVRAKRKADVDRLLPGMDGLTIIEALRYGQAHAGPGLERARCGGRSGARIARGRRRLSH